jgi:hypothetical protein
LFSFLYLLPQGFPSAHPEHIPCSMPGPEKEARPRVTAISFASNPLCREPSGNHRVHSKRTLPHTQLGWYNGNTVSLKWTLSCDLNPGLDSALPQLKTLEVTLGISM